MRKFWTKDQQTKEEKTQIDELIEQLQNDMLLDDLSIEDYQKKLVQLERLYKLKPEKANRHVSPDTVAIIAGNLIGILLIIGYEQKHVLTSKALNHVPKLR